MSAINEDINKLIDIGFAFHQDGKLEAAEEAYQTALQTVSKNAEV